MAQSYALSEMTPMKLTPMYAYFTLRTIKVSCKAKGARMIPAFQCTNLRICTATKDILLWDWLGQELEATSQILPNKYP